MKINFRLNTDEEIAQFNEMIATSGQTPSNFIRSILFCYAPQPSAIDLDAYISLSQIVSDLKKLANQSIPDATNTELFTALTTAYELTDRILNHSQPKSKLIKK